MTCPICENRWFDVDRSEEVCTEHERWIVTQCQACGRYCFSDINGGCLCCYNPKQPMKFGPGNKYARWSLVQDGYERY